MFGNSIVFNEEQFANAFTLMSLIFSLRVIVSRFTQFSKALVGIVSHFEPTIKVAFLREVLSLKSLSPNDKRLAGISTSRSEEQPSNAPSPIE